VRVGHGQPQVVAIHHRRDHRHLPDQPNRRLLR
jgi:hypothetical protein